MNLAHVKPKDFRIFIDLDGVVADWLGKAIKTFGLNINSQIVQNALATNVRGLETLIGEEYMWNRIDSEGAAWWEAIEEFPWSQYLYSEMRKLGHVCFLTQPGLHGSSAAGKVHWIKNHFNTRNYLLGAPKHMVANRYSFLIDDSPKKIEQFNEAGGHGIEFPNAMAHQLASVPVTQPYRASLGFDIVDDIVAKVKTIQQSIREHDDEWDGAAMLTYLRAGKITTTVNPEQ